MKGLFLGIALLVLIGIGGFIYRNAVSRPIVNSGACTLDAEVCPDGSSVGRVAPDCNFAPCPAPNVTIASAGIVFVPPASFASTTLPDDDSLAAFASAPASASSSPAEQIIVKDYAIPAGEQAIAVMQATALGDASGAPVAPSAFSAATLGSYTYSMVILGRSEGVVHVAYYLPRSADVLRFDSIDRNVPNWASSGLDVTTLPADAALRAMLSTMQNN